MFVGVIKVVSALQGFFFIVINLTIAVLLHYMLGKSLEYCANCQFA